MGAVTFISVCVTPLYLSINWKELFLKLSLSFEAHYLGRLDLQRAV
jgi:hypothetical protein